MVIETGAIVAELAGAAEAAAEAVEAVEAAELTETVAEVGAGTVETVTEAGSVVNNAPEIGSIAESCVKPYEEINLTNILNKIPEELRPDARNYLDEIPESNVEMRSARIKELGTYNSPVEINSNACDYLKELDCTSSDWANFSVEQQQEILTNIQERLNTVKLDAKSLEFKQSYNEEIQKAYLERIKEGSDVKEKILLDDKGVEYSRNGKLVPNTTYELNGYKYTTDSEGRIIRGEGVIKVNDAPRNVLPKIEGVEDGDDRGHVIAHILGGADTEGNLVGMESTLNRGDYKSMELELKKAAEEGHKVSLSVDIEYDSGKRPVSFIAEYTIDGETYIKKFVNKSNS